MHTYKFKISPNNKPGTSDAREISVRAEDVGKAKEKIKEMYPNVFFYGGVRIED